MGSIPTGGSNRPGRSLPGLYLWAGRCPSRPLGVLSDMPASLCRMLWRPVVTCCRCFLERRRSRIARRRAIGAAARKGRGFTDPIALWVKVRLRLWYVPSSGWENPPSSSESPLGGECCGSSDPRTSRVDCVIGSEGRGLPGRASWGSPKGASVYSQFSSPAVRVHGEVCRCGVPRD